MLTWWVYSITVRIHSSLLSAAEALVVHDGIIITHSIHLVFVSLVAE